MLSINEAGRFSSDIGWGTWLRESAVNGTTRPSSEPRVVANEFPDLILSQIDQCIELCQGRRPYKRPTIVVLDMLIFEQTI